MTVLVAPEPTTASRTVTDVLDFVTPPPGMADLRRFTLTALDEVGYLFALRSVDDPGVRMFVVPPQVYFPGYRPALGARALEELGLDVDDAVLLVVVHPGRDGAAPTANLLAPVVVNATTGRALQVVLDGDEWPLRASLSSAGAAA